MINNNNNFELTNIPNDLWSNARGVAPISSGTPQLSGQALQDVILQSNTQQPLPPRQSPVDISNNTDERGGNDDVFVAEGDSNKILGMPKGLAIGLGVAVVLVGGFLIYKKFIAKK